MRKVGIITFLVSLLVFSGVFAASNMLLPKAVPKVQEEVITDEDLGEGNVIEQIVDDELLFLVVGLDEVTQQRWSRTDTLILVHADLATGEIHLISIPRDTRVFIDDEHGNDKINHANAYGGILKTMRTVRNFLGIDLDYYVEFDFEAVKHVVDAVGGVDVNVTVPIRTWPKPASCSLELPGINTFCNCTSELWPDSFTNSKNLPKLSVSRASICSSVRSSSVKKCIALSSALSSNFCASSGKASKKSSGLT